MNLDDIFNKSFLNDFNEQEKKRIQTSKEDLIIINEKEKKLQIIIDFLNKFVELGVHVHHRDKYTKNTTTLEGIVPQKFHFYLADSSKNQHFYPGVSVYFDHPATVEIAVPHNEEEHGVVIIKVASQHDLSYLLNSKFTTYSSACEALGRFLGKCATSVEKDPITLQKEIEAKQKTKKTLEQDINTSNNLHEDVKPKEVTPSGLKKIGSLLKLKKNTDDDK